MKAYLLLAALLGCAAEDKGEPAPAPETPPAAKESATCAKRSAVLEEEMTAIVAVAQFLSDVPGGPELPVSPAGRPGGPPGPIVRLDAQGDLWFEGRDQRGNVAELVRRVEAAIEIDKSRGGEASPLYLWVDRRLKVAALARVVEALPAEVKMRLVVAAPAAPAKPPERLMAAASAQALAKDVAEADAARKG